MNFISNYALFFLQIATLVAAILITFAGIIALSGRDKQQKEKINVKKINKKYEDMQQTINEKLLDKKALKRYRKQQKAKKKLAAEQDDFESKARLFLLQFKGDIRASAVETLRDEITALLTIATTDDEVVVVLESGGGLISPYGLAASQLKRIRDKNIPLTVCIDKVAASGGYLMACVANKILAAPFAIVGSIGVVAQLPNFHRLLKKHDIDFELLTAGDYKRTLTVFGENTDKARKKFKEDLEDIHTIFKAFISNNRSAVDLNKVATGEHWLAEQALELQLVDQLITSDDYLLNAHNDDKEICFIQYQHKPSMLDKIMTRASAVLLRLRDTFAAPQQPF